MKYIIDTDPGIDDAIAIMLGYLNGLDIIGFTLTTGNIEPEKSENNIKVIQRVLNSNIKMYKSSVVNKPNSYAEFAHGIDGLGNTFFPEIEMPIEEMNAEDFIIRAVNSIPDISIICLGPHTNLANAIKKDPSIVEKVNEVIIMGASYDPNVEQTYREFNIAVDPESSNLVLNSKFKRISLITHEVGVKSFITIDEIESLKECQSTISKFTYMIAQKYIDFSKERYNVNGLSTPDPTTMAYVVDNSIVTFAPCTIKANGEMFDVLLTNESNIYVSTDFDIEKFRNLFDKTFKVN